MTTLLYMIEEDSGRGYSLLLGSCGIFVSEAAATVVMHATEKLSVRRMRVVPVRLIPEKEGHLSD